jgi:hypothetical protein
MPVSNQRINGAAPADGHFLRSAAGPAIPLDAGLPYPAIGPPPFETLRMSSEMLVLVGVMLVGLFRVMFGLDVCATCA